MVKDSCEGCRYFKGLPGEDEELVNGFCRKRSPQHPSPAFEQYRWPVVYKDDWCGEYESANPFYWRIEAKANG